MQNQPPIQLFITGGTLDKQYQETTGELVFSESFLPALLTESKCHLPVQLEVLMLKDSLEMTLQDRQRINQACLQSSSKRIVITHGTDTMVETALHLQNDLQLQDKIIVLTGAMRPFMLGHSDAPFNLGCALTAVQLSAPGVYITMNGQVFNATQVQKNRRLGLFEPL